MSDSQIFLDTTLHPVIQSLTFSAPPPNAVEGATYVVAGNPTGAWAGHEGDVAVYVEKVWVFYKPKLGWRAHAVSYGKFIWFNGTSWVEEATGEDPVNPNPDPSVKPKWYDIGVTVSDTMYANEPVVHLPILDPMYLPGNMVGSQLDMADGASPSYVQMRVQRNGNNVGTITIEQGNFNATFTTVSGNTVSFAKGDRLTVRAPQEVVAGFKNFGFVIRMGLI
ncbi:TPA: DUF2793 domain-containing protein [Serratia marcescens]